MKFSQPESEGGRCLPLMEGIAGRRGLIVGIANEISIAYGCAEVLRQAGAELA